MTDHEPTALRQQLQQRIDFILEIDKLKQIMRRTTLLDRSRPENDAEHSWHLALMALVLAPYADEPVDLARVLTLVLVHDLVEIDAGDTFLYDDEAHKDKAIREQRAAERIFGLLPDPEGSALRAAWEEFEARATPEARFANTLDRLQPVLHNYHTGGGTWHTPGVTYDKVLARTAGIGAGSTALWDYTQSLLQAAVGQGLLRAPGGDAAAAD